MHFSLSKLYILQIQCSCFYFKSLLSLHLCIFCSCSSSVEGRNCIMSFFICGTYNVILICILFHLSSNALFPPSDAFTRYFKSHRLPLVHAMKRNEIIFDRGLMAIVRNKWWNNSFIATKRQYNRWRRQRQWERRSMKWVFVGFPLGLRERWKIKSQYFILLPVVDFFCARGKLVVNKNTSWEISFNDVEWVLQL